jgi:hypothetical protein
MTSSVGLWAVLANVAVLLVLAAAVAWPRVSQLARLVISVFGFLCAWLIVASLDVMGAPKSTVLLGGAVIVVSIVVVLATLHRWMRTVDAGEAHSEDRDDEGGGGPRRDWPDFPQGGGGGCDPSWWPEFERRFASYVAEREADNRRPAALPN